MTSWNKKRIYIFKCTETHLVGSRQACIPKIWKSLLSTPNIHISKLEHFQPGGNQNNPNSPTYNGGIGGGVYPGGGGNNGGVQRDEGGYCNSNTDCRSGLYCTASVNGVKICLSTSNGGGGNGFPSGNGGCQTSSNCQYGSVCVVTNGQGNCQIQTGGYVSPARQGMVRYPSSNSITVG